MHLARVRGMIDVDDRPTRASLSSSQMFDSPYPPYDPTDPKWYVQHPSSFSSILLTIAFFLASREPHPVTFNVPSG